MTTRPSGRWIRLGMAAGACVAVALAASPRAALADDCAGDGTQSALNMCADDAFKAADATLNARYAEILARLEGNAELTERLRAAQRAWVAFRDAECDFATAAVEGGSIYPMVAAECAQGLTEERIKAFDVFLSCKEGDLTCPVPPG